MGQYRECFAIVAMALALCGCVKETGVSSGSRAGTPVRFSASNGGSLTRSSYSGVKDSENFERIDWVEGDRVRIYSSEASPVAADYAVSGGPKDGRVHGGTLSPLDAGAAMRWGESDPHHFYAVYPVPGGEGTGGMVSVSEGTVEARLPRDQSFAVTKTNELGRDYYADMRFAYMAACADGSPSGNDPVTLSFSPIVTTFYVTVVNPYGDSPFHLKSVSLSSSSSVLTGTWETALSSGGSRSYRYWEGGSYGTSWTRTEDNSSLRFDWMGDPVPAGGSVTVALFAVPHDITGLTLTVVADEGTSSLDFKRSDTGWITFAGGLKHDINNVKVPDWVYDIETNEDVVSVNHLGEPVTRLRVRSVKTYGSTADEQAAHLRPTPWKTQVKMDSDGDSVPDTWTDLSEVPSSDRPEWMPADFPVGGNPEYADFVEYAGAKMRAQGDGNAPVSHEERLRTAWVDELEAGRANQSPVAGHRFLDLSKWNFVNHGGGNRTTANSYIVQGPGYYMFPMVYGNAIDMVNYNSADNTQSYNPNISGAGILNQFRNHKRNALVSGWTGYRIKQPWVSRDRNFGSATTRVVIVWQDFNNGEDVIELVSGTGLGYYDQHSYANGLADRFVLFYVDSDKVSPGNAVIAVQENTEGNWETAWSWHIWITDQNMYPVSLSNSSRSDGYPMQPVNLGWVDESEGTWYAPREDVVRFVPVEYSEEYKDVVFRQGEFERISTYGRSPFYQWGRKDPFNQEGWTVTSDESHHVYYSIQHPDVVLGHSIVGSEYDWTDNGYRNLWKAENKRYHYGEQPFLITYPDQRTATTGRKTVYDPCPRGYVVAPGRTWDGVSSTRDVWFDAGEGRTAGWMMDTGHDDGIQYYLPAMGYIRFEGSSAEYRNEAPGKGYYWTDFPSSLGVDRHSIGLKFDSSGSEINGECKRAYAFSVRCVREDGYLASVEGGTPVPIYEDPVDPRVNWNYYMLVVDSGTAVATSISGGLFGTTYDRVFDTECYTSGDAEESTSNYVAYRPFTVSGSGSVMYGNLDEDLRDRITMDAATRLDIALDAPKGQVTAKAVEIACYSGSSTATVDLYVNGSTASLGEQTVSKIGDDDTDIKSVLYEFSSPTAVTSIGIRSSQVTDLYSITVYY